MSAMTAAPADAFAGVDTWIFDLDNTLYPSHSDVFPQVERRIQAYVERHFGLSPLQAEALRKDTYQRYGTTLRGLMVEHRVDPHDFLAFVHDIDHSPLEPDPALGAALSLLPGRKFVLTNGSRQHAQNIIRRLDIERHFEDLFDIVAAEFTPKPAEEAYARFVARHGIGPERAAMFEDLARNLEVPKRLGMRTVLVVPASEKGRDQREAWELAGRDQPYIDHVTADLPQFLVRIAEGLGAAPAH
jgi:putative hydrolase of the HAD superfamily